MAPAGAPGWASSGNSEMAGPVARLLHVPIGPVLAAHCSAGHGGLAAKRARRYARICNYLALRLARFGLEINFFKYMLI